MEVPRQKQSTMENGQKGRFKIMVADLQKSRSGLGQVKALSRIPLMSAAIDLIPFLGGIKQLNEAVDGEVYATDEKLHGKKRIVHGLVGAASFALDATGLGEMQKGTRVVGKSVGAMKGLAGRLSARGATKGAALAEKSAAFMVKNPKLVRAAESIAEDHLDDGIRYVRSASKDDARKTLKEEAGKYLPQDIADQLVDEGEKKIQNLKTTKSSPEEQKSKLQASRSRIQSKQLSPTRFEMGRKHFSIADPQRPGELLHTQATRAAGAKDLFDVAELETKRKAGLFASQLQGALGRGRQAEASRQAVMADPARFGGNLEEDSAQQAQAQQAQRLAGIQAAVSAQTQQQAQSQQTQQADEKTRQQREALKQTAKATMRRGAIFVTNSIAAAFDLGSSGISFIINIVIYMFTLGWLNLEMIYGRYFMKGKSKYVGPISWAPIPMPVDKNAIILSGFVVAADIALGIAALMLTFGGFCILHDMVKVTSSVAQAVSIGASIAQGEAGGLCLGGILTSAFGL